ncbi:MAG: peptidoglycan DD-metalloendopeptidase family protein [Blastocatellia bacterium]|nr:peptidoglycan DD-metalloendopeptidase family protein [Blastocatellia bacterium]
MTIAFETEVRPSSSPGRASANRELAARRAATEFEALLLSHITAALAPAEEESDEGGIFSGGATGFYRQMFSEQLARALAERGGLGLSDTVLRQLDAAAPVREARGARRLAEVTNLVRNGAADIERPAAPEPAARPGAVEIRLPIEGRISSHFGDRRDPMNGRLRHHAGVDIAAEQGTPIPAAAPGSVIFAGRRGGYGNLVEIEHADGRVTRYAHAERIFVAVGDVVQTGQPIATVGSTGRSTGPHLHFEVSENGARVDPLQVAAKDSVLPRR